MTDRELLEMAAKAAGLRVKTWDGHTGVMCAIDNDRYGRMWMPLTDDGDALRLAVKLGLCITQYPIYAEPKHSVLVKRPQLRDDDRERIEEIAVYNGDPYAATRRAIVRAAAAIGEKMP